VSQSTNKRDLREYMSDSNTLLTFLLTSLTIIVPTFSGTDFLKQLIKLDVDGLILYQCVFAILAVSSSFLILYTVSRLLSVSKERSRVKKYSYYTFIFFMLAMLSLSLREFYAPSGSFSDYFLKKEGKVIYSLVQEEAGVEFELETCSKSGTQVICNLIIKNTSDEDLIIKNLNNTYMFDQNNNEAKLERIHIADDFIESYKDIQLTRRSAANLRFYFKYSKNAAPSMVKKLNMKLKYSEGYREITFRNIQIERSSPST
jgi:uncharacterized membrane protein YidH (DUF202 family)